MSLSIEEKKNSTISKVFSPTAPIKEESFFRGRIEQLKRIVEVMNEDGQHAILFGERGVGKTSMANIVCKRITNIYSTKVTCNSSDNFQSLWISALNQLKLSQTTQGIGFKPEMTQTLTKLGESLSKQNSVQPHDVYSVLLSLPNHKFLFVFDEFDNIKDQHTRVKFSDLIKTLSDNSIFIKIMVVGIGDNVINLIGNHQSLERCLMQIKMPRMSGFELDEIITKGFEELEMNIEPSVKQKILLFSSGFPHYTHLLCKYAVKNALERKSDIVTQLDLSIAIEKAIKNTTEQLRDSYSKAISASNGNKHWKSIINACSTCSTDEFDSFSISDILTKFNELTGKMYTRASINNYIMKLCQDKQGLILEKTGTGRSIKYHFYNPMMKPFILLKMEEEQRLSN